MKQIQEKAYAKINLHLDVTGRLENGFHLVNNVMQSVSLWDEVTLTETDGAGICITCNRQDVPCDERNLAYLAAEAFLDKTGISAAVDITVRKYIPDRAGLGGGSSDAAAVLRALNMALGNPLSKDALCALGETLGSDVPFCIVGGTRLCEGKGEKMSMYSTPGGIYVIVPPVSEKVETPKAYRLLDAAFDNFADENAALHEELFGFFDEDPILGMYNVFEGVVIPGCPEVHEVRVALYNLGAMGALMSGSGSAVFGVFDTEEEAEAAAKELPGAVICRPIDALL